MRNTFDGDGDHVRAGSKWLMFLAALLGAVLLLAFYFAAALTSVGLALLIYLRTSGATAGIGMVAAGTPVVLHNGARFTAPSGWDGSWSDDTSQIAKELAPNAPEFPNPVQELTLGPTDDADGGAYVDVNVYRSEADLRTLLQSRLGTGNNDAVPVVTANPRAFEMTVAVDATATAVVMTSTPDPAGDRYPVDVDLIVRKSGQMPMEVRMGLPAGDPAVGGAQSSRDIAAALLRYLGFSWQ